MPTMRMTRSPLVRGIEREDAKLIRTTLTVRLFGHDMYDTGVETSIVMQMVKDMNRSETPTKAQDKV